MYDTADFFVWCRRQAKYTLALAPAQAYEQELAIVPVLNKVDLPSAEPDKVAEQMQQVRMFSAPTKGKHFGVSATWACSHLAWHVFWRVSGHQALSSLSLMLLWLGLELK